MRDYQQKANILIFSMLVVCIFCSSSPENYTAVYLNSIRIGSQSIEIPMIVNTLTSQTTLFSNSNRKYAKEIQAGRQSDILIEKIEINGELISSFPFILQIDPTKLNNADIQGEFGFGINNQNTSDFIETLLTNQIITQRQIEILTPKADKEKTISLSFEPNANDFTFCKLTKRNDLDTDDLYSEAWICRLTHLLIGSTGDDLVWDKSLEINNRVAFDSRTKYVYIPSEYLDYISNLWEVKENKCKLVKNLSSREKYFVCDREVEEKLKDFKSLYFLIDGYGYRLTATELFEFDGKNWVSLVRFIKSLNDIWVLGIPFFKNYKVLLDYDQLSIGFNGENVLNFTEGYETWVQEENDNIIKTLIKTSDEKKLMIVGTILGSSIIFIVLFLFIRSYKRENPKYHIELNEHYDKKDFYQ